MLSSKKVKKEEPLKGKQNPFDALQSSDSDSESESENGSEEPVATVVQNTRKFVKEKDWELVKPNDTRTFFSKLNKNKSNRNTHRTNDNGWTSIAWSKPRFIDTKVEEDEEERKIREERLEELMEAEAKTPPIYEKEEVREEKEEEEKEKPPAQIKDWALKIRDSLEKAEKEKPKPKEKTELSEDFISSLGKLSFFRKPMTVEN
jgi:hypothetical protein